MKICTDACILGGYAAGLVKNLSIRTCLDIGTGTGLLSLMLAQAGQFPIDAIEIYDTAASEAKENFQLSPWKDRINIIHKDFRSFTSPDTYDLIISNPPFYENHLPSPERNRNVAMHSESLNLRELLEGIERNVYESGHFIVLLPRDADEEFEKMCMAKGFNLLRKLKIRHSIKHPYFRVILFYGRLPGKLVEEELVIKDAGNFYTVEFRSLLKEYYLSL